MPRALYLGLPMHGHVNPSLALIRALVELGQSVLYACTPNFGPQIEGAGAQLLPYRTLLDANHLLTPFALASHEFEAALRQVYRPARDFGASYALVDGLNLWGRALALALGLPVVSVFTTYAPPALPAEPLPSLPLRVAREFSAPGGERMHASSEFDLLSTLALSLERVRQAPGFERLDAWSVFAAPSALSLICTLPEFQPHGEAVPRPHVFVGPSLDQARLAEVWTPPGDRPLVYLSLGTLFGDDPEVLKRCLDAFPDDHYQVVVGGAPPGLASPGPQVQLLTHAPQAALLRHAEIFVSHGGMNGLMEALAAGVPVVASPFTAEQGRNAATLTRLGVGLNLSRPALDGPQLRAAVDELARNPMYRQRALALNAAERGRRGVQQAAEAVLNLQEA